MKLLTKFAAIFDRGVDSLAFLAIVILVLLWGLISTEVLARLLANYSMVWLVNLSEVCVFAVAFLGAAWVLKVEGHVKVDIVTGRLKPRAQASLETITSIIGVVICLFLVWYGTKVTISHFQRGIISHDVLRMVVWPRYAVVALGSLLLVIQFCRRAYRNLMLCRRSEGKEVAPSEKRLL